MSSVAELDEADKIASYGSHGGQTDTSQETSRTAIEPLPVGAKPDLGTFSPRDRWQPPLPSPPVRVPLSIERQVVGTPSAAPDSLVSADPLPGSLSAEELDELMKFSIKEYIQLPEIQAVLNPGGPS